MKQTYTVPVRLSEDLIRRMIYIAEAEGRTPNNQFILMLRNNIQYFERTKGKINQADLAKIDLTPYMTPDDRSDDRPEGQTGDKSGEV